MAGNIATIVDWFGPYSGATKEDIIATARIAARKDYGWGLYAAIGERPPGVRALLYVGVGAPLATRLTEKSHHKLSEVPLSDLWLGEVSVAGLPGRRRKKINPHLDIVEWAMAYFLQPPFNVRKRSTAPPQSCVVVSRWWATDYETASTRPVARWADIIEYDADRRTANLVWFGERARVESVEVASK